MYPAVSKVIAACASEWGVTPEQIISKQSTPTLRDARTASMALSKHLKVATQAQVARGHRRPVASVLHAEKRAADLREVDPEFRRRWDATSKTVSTEFRKQENTEKTCKGS